MNNQYKNPAIKYRPKRFSDLIGQNVLVQVLSNAIINHKVASAYLLSGIRGIGKTTSARIIASTLNCENPVISENMVELCHNCSNCKAYLQNNHPDIIEIDAASRTGVDDIRFVIESSEYKPLLGKYKIFIIDEVHMLSKNAFNALLKTLEEPPKNVTFIFATTEVNKIPITVISRCQRFDLKRLSQIDIKSILVDIAKKENIHFDEAAIELIAYRSEGSARDAISILDQAALLGYGIGSNNISVKLVQEMLAITSLENVIVFVHSILKQDVNLALDIIDEINKNSCEIIYFVENVLDIIGYLTKLIMVKEYKESMYIPYQSKLLEIANNTNIEILTIIWQIFSKSLFEFKNTHNEVLSLEMITVKSIYATQIMLPSNANNIISSILPRQ